MKKKLLIIALGLFKYHLRFFYFFIKLFTIRRKRVFLLSRQSNEMSLNYKLIVDELNRNKIQYVCVCRKVPSSINMILRNEKRRNNVFIQLKNIILYYFNLYKQMYFFATSKIAIIDGYNVTASLLNHKKGTKIIQLWHALATIKKFGYKTIGHSGGLDVNVAKVLCMHKNYDYVISGSIAMNKFFAESFNVPIERVIACGTPTVDYLLKPNDRVVNRIYKMYPKLKNKINILYSPTFRTDGSNNDAEVINNFDFDNYNLIMTFHPKNDNNIHDDKVLCINQNDFNTLDILRVVDYVITDYSALSIDACVLNKKVLIYAYDYEKYINETGLNIDLFKDLSGNVSKDFKELMAIIKNNKYNMKSYERFRKKYITNISGNSAKRICEIVKENL